MKKILLTSIVILLSFIGLNNLKAYTTVGYYDYYNGTNERISPVVSDIRNINNSWGDNGSQVVARDPSFYDIGQYVYIGGATGDNLVVHADYYFGIRVQAFYDPYLENYLSTSRNSLKSSNLKCGLGNFYQGYDNTFSPEITNFNVTYDYVSSSIGKQYLYHVTYDYKQRINNVNLSGTNLWCSFGNNINDVGLFSQMLNNGVYSSQIYFSYINTFSYSVSNDPNTSLLQDITSQNDTIIQQNTEINNSINNVENSINDLTDSQKVCEIIDKDDVTNNGKFLSNDGSLGNSDYYGVTDYIDISDSNLTVLTVFEYNLNRNVCYYNASKTLLSCQNLYNLSNLTIPNNSQYMRVSIYNYGENNTPVFKVCRNGNQSISTSINDINNTIVDDNVDNATNTASNFFSNFTTSTHGLTSIITAPLSAIQTLTSSTCQPLVLPLPFIDTNLTLPCMRDIYVEYFGSFMSLFDIITLGIVSYWVLIRIFNLVKDFKNPEHDEIEVVDL